jgi:pimeloyl-ACP methyl ester carboxylesterase
MNTFFSSPKAKKEIEKLYLQKLDELSIRYEFMNVETTYGDTNIVITGQKEKHPLVLLHGSNGCAPVALEAMIDLIEDFRIYAIDIPGQPNLSAEFRPSMKDAAYGKWMYEILSRLGVRNAFLVGISFGGFVAWKTLVFDEKRISKAFLITPAGIVNGNPMKSILKVFLPMKRYKRQKEMKYVQQFLGELFSEKDEFAEVFLSKVFLHFKMDFSPIPLITKKEAQLIKTPVHIFAADNDLLFPGRKMLKRAKNIFPSLKKTILLEGSKHVPSKQNNSSISEFIHKHI